MPGTIASPHASLGTGPLSANASRTDYGAFVHAGSVKLCGFRHGFAGFGGFHSFES